MFRYSFVEIEVPGLACKAFIPLKNQTSLIECNKTHTVSLRHGWLCSVCKLKHSIVKHNYYE